MFKFSKKFLSLIMAILMLTMTAIGVNAEELITGIDDLLIDIGIIDPSPEEELMPMAANECSIHGTPEHYAAMIAYRDSFTNATKSWLNISLNSAGLIGNRRPDVIVQVGNTFYVHEVISPSQTVSEITTKIDIMKKDNEDSQYTIVWTYQEIGGNVVTY